MTNEFRGSWTIDCMITKFDSTSNSYRTEYSDVRFGSCVTNTVEYNGAQLYERGRKAPSRSQSGVAVRDLRRTAFSSRCRPIGPWNRKSADLTKMFGG
jgi:hypothetical protein